MTGVFLVRPTTLAAEQIRNESRWWRKHRTKAPKLFREELRRVLQLIAAHPDIGAVAADVELAEVRRVHLAETHHYLYYRVDELAQTVDVLAVWSTFREGPPL